MSEDKKPKKKQTRKKKLGRPKMAILNPKQRMFIDQYLVNGNNMRKAYAIAYSKDMEGMTDKELNKIDSNASALFKKKHVQSYLDKQYKKTIKKLEITKEKLLEHMANIAFGNIAVLMAKIQIEFDPLIETFKINAENLTEDEQKLIQQLDFDARTGRIKMQGYRADAMLVKLYEMLGYSREEKESTNVQIVWEEKKSYSNPNLIEHKEEERGMNDLKPVLEKMCGMVGADYNKIDFKEDGWYSKHTWTIEQENEFKAWLEDYFYTNKTLFKKLYGRRALKKTIKQDVMWFVFMYGWKTKVV